MKSGFLDKLIERLDRLDAGSLQTQFLRLAGEKGLLETIFHAIQEGIDRARRATGGSPMRTARRRRCWGFHGRFGGRASRFRGICATSTGTRCWTSTSGRVVKLMSREIEITYPEHRFLDFYIVPLPR
jgi:two-component system, sporulation sensor kinase E